MVGKSRERPSKLDAAEHERDLMSHSNFAKAEDQRNTKLSNGLFGQPQNGWWSIEWRLLY